MMELVYDDIIEYILIHYPEIKFWDGVSKWSTFSQYKEFKHRQGMLK